MKRKIAIVVIAMIMALDLVTSAFAAGGQQSGKKRIVVGYIAKNTTDTFHFPLNSAAREKLDGLKAQKVIDDWHFYDGLTDPVTQVALMDTAITQGCNYIIFLPAESAGSAPVLDKAKEKGIPVVVVNSTTSNTDALAAAYVGSDDVQAGQMMAQFIQKKFPSGGSYAHLEGPIGNSAQIDRTKGVHDIMDKDPKWTLLDEQSAEWQGDKAATFADQWRTKFGSQLNAIICDNDDMSVGARTVLIGAGRRDVVTIGVDGTPAAFSMVKSGDLDASIFQDGVGQVTKGIDLVVDLINGKSIPKRTMIDFVLVTRDNVDRYMTN